MSHEPGEDDLTRREALEFVEFIARHEQQWVSALMRLGLNRTEAELLLTRILQGLWEHPTFDPSHPGANGYVRTRLDLRTRDFEKSRRSRTKTGVGRQDDSDPATESVDKREHKPQLAAMRAEARRTVWEAVCRLPEEEAFAITCRYWLEMAYTNIASLRGVPVTTVTNWLARAKARLRKELDPDLFPEDDDQ